MFKFTCFHRKQFFSQSYSPCLTPKQKEKRTSYLLVLVFLKKHNCHGKYDGYSEYLFENRACRMSFLQFYL